jgi:hypothetical protein
VLALSTSAGDRPLIEWIARHPLLSVPELAALLNEYHQLIARRLEWLVRCGAIRLAAATAVSTDERQSTWTDSW